MSEKWKGKLNEIFSEVIRIEGEIKKGNARFLKDDELFFKLTSSHVNYDIYCGRKAKSISHELANEILRRGKLQGKVSSQAIREEFEIQFVNIIFSKDVSDGFSIHETNKLLDRVVTTARKMIVKSIHYIPCRLIHFDNDAHIKMGPVSFKKIESLKNNILSKVRRKELITYLKKENRHYISDVVKYYNGFQWYAEVSIDSCDIEMAKEQASTLVNYAINCMCLILGAQHSTGFKISDSEFNFERKAGLIVLPDSMEINPSLNIRIKENSVFTGDWPCELMESERGEILELCGLVLDGALDYYPSNTIGQRFLDSIQWFGEATRESNCATRILKYIISLERLVITKKVDCVSEVLSSRVSILCSNNRDEWPKWKCKIKKVYDVRSRLVHGTLSPKDKDVERSLNVCIEITEMALTNLLYLWGKEGLAKKIVTNEQLDYWFETFSEWVNNLSKNHSGNK
ncbi:HEPN domain-containing protein [Pectobacterium aroidearum]|uniref:HEPN domain-containing protein n=1 Tax=Pectobacterium aroidearum TaxID=1201031 RepID=UPI002A80D3C4|nr:HEPN domain-containing protein [Pectobacterium aroidearum]MDY4385071.1 HEPN domain-containing protein [Pectobacterium aroidearum]